MDKEPSHYQLLQVDPKAEVTIIRSAFRNLISKYHPDVPRTGDKQMFDKLTEAWKVLSDKTRRAAYDKTLRENEP